MSLNTWNVPDEIMNIIGELLLLNNDDFGVSDDDVGGVDVSSDDDVGGVDVSSDDDAYVDQEHVDEINTSNGKKRSLELDDTFTVNDSASMTMNPTAPKKVKSKSFQELEQDFYSLLEERKVSPFSTWIVEKEKLQLDERASGTHIHILSFTLLLFLAGYYRKKLYRDFNFTHYPSFLALDPMDQKDLFEKWLILAAEKALEEKKAIDAMSPRAKYSLLLQEAITDKNWKSARFADFSRRFKNDVRFLHFTPSSSSSSSSSAKEKEVFSWSITI